MTIIEYVKEINKLQYNIDISFIDEFLDLVTKDECCIHHSLLTKYGILSGNSTAHVKRLLDQYALNENEDYQLSKVGQRVPQGGYSYKNEYYLHPNAFKLCLMRSLKTKKYAKYYLLLEKCVKYFSDYQNKLKELYYISLLKKKEDDIIIKDDKIDRMEALLKCMNLKLDDTLEKLDDTHHELEHANDKLDNSEKILTVVTKKLNIAVEDRVPKANNDAMREYFILLKSDIEDYKYYAIRGQKRYVDRKIKDKESYHVLKTIEYIPNAINLWIRMKEQLKCHVDYCNNRMNLIDINEKIFLKRIDEIYNQKNNVSVN
jgi:phage anti-repressor protein